VHTLSRISWEVKRSHYAGQSHQQVLCLLLYHGGQRTFRVLYLSLNGMLRMDTPNAIDQMFSSFAGVHDPRRQPPTTLHPLAAMLTITILATICGAHNWVAIEPWGHAHHPWLAEFLALHHGLPSHDPFGRVLAFRDPPRLPQALTAWRRARAALAEDVMALDGQTIRRSLERADGTGAMHGVRAWASTNALGLAQCTGENQSNARTALPEWLAMLHLPGRVVTIAAMGCQGERARQSIDPGGASVLSVKENPPGLPRDCEELCTWRRGPHPLAEEVGLGY
jgi:DDE_Tnp_1-associated